MADLGGKPTDERMMCYGAGMRLTVAFYAVAMIALIIGLDMTIFRHHVWERLAVNVGIVLIFGAVYFRLLRSA